MALEDLEGIFDSLGSSAAGLESPLADLADRLGSLAAGAAAAGVSMAGVGDQLRDSKGRFIAAGDAAGMAAAKMKEAAAAADAASQPQRDFGNSLLDSAKSAFNLPGPIGDIQNALAKLGPEGEAAAAALGLATIGVTALAAAIIGCTIAAYTIIDQRDDLLTLFAALAGGEAAGSAVLGVVDKLATELPFATNKIAEWAKGLLSAGVKAEDLESAVKAVASATALMGEGGGAAAKTMIERLAMGGDAAEKMMKQLQEGGPKSAKLLAEMGLNTADLAKAMGMTPEAFKTATISAEEMNKAIQKALQQKGAGALENMLGDFPVMLMKMREGFMSLFEKLGKPMGKLMESVGKLFKEFYKGSPFIVRLQGIVTTVFTALFSWATRAVTAIHSLFTWLTNATKGTSFFSSAITALKVGWAALGVIWKLLSATLAPIISMLVKIFTSAMVLKGLKTLFTVIVVVIVSVVVALATLGAAFAAVAGVVMGAVGAIVGAVVGVVGSIAEMVGEVIGYLSELTGAGAMGGAGLVDGLVNGIMAGIASVGAAAAALGGAAKSALLGVLGIASPSAVAEDAATNVGDTFASTTEKQSGKTQKAFDKAVDPKKPKGGKGGKGASGGDGSGGPLAVFENCNFFGVDRAMFEEMVDEVMEKKSREVLVPS